MLEKILIKILNNKFACIIFGIIFLILAHILFATSLLITYRAPSVCIILSLICFASAFTGVANALASFITFMFNVILKFITFFVNNLKNKPILFLITLISIFLTIAAFYIHSTDIMLNPCPFKTLYCLLVVDRILRLFEWFGFILSFTGIFFLMPKGVREKIFYYIFDFSKDCERKYLIPLIIIHTFVILSIPYLFIVVFPKPSFSLISEQFAAYNILLGLLMIIMIGIGFIVFRWGLIVDIQRLFDKNDIDYKEIRKSKSYSEFLYGEEQDSKPNPKNDTSFKRDKE